MPLPAGARAVATSRRLCFFYPPRLFNDFAPPPSSAAVFFGSNDDHVYAVDLASGHALWTFSTAGDVYSTPQVYDNETDGSRTIFVGSYDQNVYALDARTGAVRWKTSTLGYVIASPTVIVTGDSVRVYVGCDQTLDETLFYAIEAASGDIAWTYFVENAAIWSTAKPVLSNSAGPLVAFGDQNGYLWALKLP